MSEKGLKRKTVKNIKKVSRDKNPATLRLDYGAFVDAKSIYKKDSRVFNINDIDIGKIKISDKTKNIIHVSIMCFMKIIMNTFL